MYISSVLFFSSKRFLPSGHTVQQETFGTLLFDGVLTLFVENWSHMLGSETLAASLLVLVTLKMLELESVLLFE